LFLYESTFLLLSKLKQFIASLNEHFIERYLCVKINPQVLFEFNTQNIYNNAKDKEDFCITVHQILNIAIRQTHYGINIIIAIVAGLMVGMRTRLKKMGVWTRNDLG